MTWHERHPPDRPRGTFGPLAVPRRAHDEAHEEVTVEVVASAPGIYLGWGAFTIQLGNLIVIGVMLLLFVLALLLPFPKARRRR